MPVLDGLRKKYPDAQITVLVPPRPSEIFLHNPAVAETVIFDKHAKLAAKVRLFFDLSKKGFDLVVDLRNSFFGAFLPVKNKSLFWGPLRKIPAGIKHMKQKHLFWAYLSEGDLARDQPRSINISDTDREYIDRILAAGKAAADSELVVIAPGARSQVKCWSKENFSRLIRVLIKDGMRVVLVGDDLDRPVCDYLAQGNGGQLIDLCGQTSLGQLSALLQKARLLITNDSAVMHLASYLNLPVVAIFGPTSEEKYGPWSLNSATVKKEVFCRPCEKAQCRFGHLKCLTAINPPDVFRQVKAVLGKENSALKQTNGKTVPVFKRILMVRNDRLGDVLLSTPAIKALRQGLPQSYITMLVSPYTREVLEGNLDLDEIITFDKEAKDKGFWAALRFIKFLRQKRFDLAVILHPTSRMHWFTFLAGIPKRLGYERKCGFLLTDKIKHDKQLGQKHESEYALEMLKYLGIPPADTALFMPIKDESEKWAQALLKDAQIKDSDRLLIIHPTASCPSRIWPPERFARVADKLAQRYGFKVIIVSDPKDMQKSQLVIKHMRTAGLFLAGKTSISQLASLLKRSQLFISTDSGPMHLACALQVPVITIFGRSQPGLSPKRWGPQGKMSRILHKTVGCTTCLAHDCQKGFACLMATTVEDVLLAADSLLKNP